VLLLRLVRVRLSLVVLLLLLMLHPRRISLGVLMILPSLRLSSDPSEYYESPKRLITHHASSADPTRGVLMLVGEDVLGLRLKHGG
jgi:hypothetical protein